MAEWPVIALGVQKKWKMLRGEEDVSYTQMYMHVWGMHEVPVPAW